jgi:hypothetical protein
MTITEMIDELEQAIMVLNRLPPKTGFLVLPESTEKDAYRRGARDAYELVVKALREIAHEGA